MTPLPHVPGRTRRRGNPRRDRTENGQDGCGPRPSESTRTQTTPHVAGWRAAACTGPLPVPLPVPIRWLPAGLLGQHHQGAGAIVAAFAPVDEWAERWPYLPTPTCIELVHLDDRGFPTCWTDRLKRRASRNAPMAFDRGRSVCLVTPGRSPPWDLRSSRASLTRWRSHHGPPRPQQPSAAISGLQADRLLDWLSRWSSVTVYADDDPDGIASARRLRRLLAHRGLEVGVYTLTGDHNDPGDYAAANPLDVVDMDAAREFARDLEDRRECTRWEAARLAMMTVGPLPDSDVMSTTNPS